jgi:hypothetical protein
VQQQQCNSNSATATVQQQQCNSNSATATVQQQQCNSATATVQQQQCNSNSATATVQHKLQSVSDGCQAIIAVVNTRNNNQPNTHDVIDANASDNTREIAMVLQHIRHPYHVQIFTENSRHQTLKQFVHKNR